MADLVQAYPATGERRYAAKLDELLRSWIRANPIPLDHNGGSDPAWETLCAGCRFKRTWLEAFFALLPEPAFRDETFAAMFKSMWEHAEFLLRCSTRHSTNWLVIESQALSCIGLLFPEFLRARLWRGEGLKRLADEIECQVHPDGAHHKLPAGGG